MDQGLRRATPLVLLALAGLVWLERCLPFGDTLAQRLGSDGVLRVVVGLLAIYTALLVVERQRLDSKLTQLLGALKQVAASRKADPTVPKDAEREALQILVGALDSPDAAVRSAAAQHLRRLTGQDLGEDARRWSEWLAKRPAGTPARDPPGERGTE